jgi:hypothetical protein
MAFALRIQEPYCLADSLGNGWRSRSAVYGLTGLGCGLMVSQNVLAVKPLPLLGCGVDLSEFIQSGLIELPVIAHDGF